MSLDANAASWTAAELVADVRRKARIPAGSVDFTDADLRRELSNVIWSFAGWATSQASEGRQMLQLPRTVASAWSVPYGPLREVDMPPLAVGDAIDGVFWLNSSGQAEKRLALIDLNSQPLYDTPGSQGDPWGYSLIDGRIRVYPRPSTGGTLRINYQRRHGALCDVDLTRACTSSSSTTSYVTFSHGSTQLLDVGDYFDVINDQYPYRFVAADAPVSTGSTPTALRTTSLTSTTFDLNPTGMTIVERGQTPYVHLPLEFSQCVAQKGVEAVLRAAGDMVGAQAAAADAVEELGRVIGILNPRTKSARQKVVNPYSHMRSRRRR